MEFWNITKTQYRVSDFMSWMKAGTLDLNPPFQRRSVWKPGAKSLLIDTVMRGLPVPILFLRDVPANLDSLEPGREVVDGQQRLRTLISFIRPALLKDFDKDRDQFTLLKSHNAELTNTPFDKFPDAVKRRILDYQFSVHVFPSETDDRQVLDVFARLNSTGMKLNHQEMRNASYFGELKTIMYRLATEQLYRWQDWSVFDSDDIARMQEVELTSELVQMMIEGVRSKAQGALDRFYDEYDEVFDQGPEVARRFYYVMDVIDDHFKGTILLEGYNKRPLFYALFSAIYHVIFRIGSDLVRTPIEALRTTQIQNLKQKAAEVSMRVAPELVIAATERRTTHPASRIALIEFISGQKV